MTNILLTKHQPYYNRIRTKHDSVTEYENPECFAYFSNVNFFKGDGINTELTINSSSLLNGPVSLVGEITNANYLVEFDSDSNIVSRWYIMECQNTREGQWRIFLRRDVVCDNMDKLLESTAYIEKATVLSPYDPAVYNDEGMRVNQIKDSEELLKDKSGVPWIIGYYASNTEARTISFPSSTIADSINVSTLSAWDLQPFMNSDYKYAEKTDIRLNVTDYRSIGSHYSFSKKGILENDFTSTVGVSGNLNTAYNFYMRKVSEIEEYFFSNYTQFKDQDIRNYDGKVLYVSSGDNQGYNTIRIVETGRRIYTVNVSKNAGLSNFVYEKISGYPGLDVENIIGNNPITYEITTREYRIQLIPIDSENISVNWPSTSRQLTDAPYKMFAMPLEPIWVLTSTSEGGITCSKENTLKIASGIAEALGSSLYDIQLLPYFPMLNNVIESDYGKEIQVNSLTANVDYVPIIKNGIYYQFIFFPSQSSFSFDIEKTIDIPSNVTELKIMNQCENWRITSPNYSSTFDFNAVKTGRITNFNVDCTYKPYSPYIHVNPSFGNLYGSDFNDARGLVCQGDFSVPIMGSKWEEYQINNKNYLNAFNREVESIELKNSFGMANDIFGIIGGTVGGAMKGKVGGALLGAAAGGYNLYKNETLRRDSLDLTKDRFNFNLQNIQAQPYTLAKISSFDYNNKLFPILEHYSCTDKERDAFREKIKYEGMSIGRIEKIGTFVLSEPTFIRGLLIRTEIEGDNHMISEISNELQGGIYIAD